MFAQLFHPVFVRQTNLCVNFARNICICVGCEHFTGSKNEPFYYELIEDAIMIGKIVRLVFISRFSKVTQVSHHATLNPTTISTSNADSSRSSSAAENNKLASEPTPTAQIPAGASEIGEEMPTDQSESAESFHWATYPPPPLSLVNTHPFLATLSGQYIQFDISVRLVVPTVSIM